MAGKRARLKKSKPNQHPDMHEATNELEPMHKDALIEGQVMAKSEPKKEPEPVNPNIVVPKTRRVLDLL